MKNVLRLASLIRSQARKGVSTQQLEAMDAAIDAIMSTAPHGSGFDMEATLDLTSKGDRLVINMAFHHMDDNGYYDGWTEHSIIVTPTLDHVGFNLRITGRDKREIKEYIAETYYHWLSEEAKNV